MNWDLVKRLLREFDYDRNGVDATICFLIEMLHLLVNGDESDEEESDIKTQVQ